MKILSVFILILNEEINKILNLFKITESRKNIEIDNNIILHLEDEWIEPEFINLPTHFLQRKFPLRDSEDYVINECELSAKDYQKAYGGHIVFVAPYDTTTGRWIKCKFCGHWLNHISIDGKSYYLDYPFKHIFIDNNELGIFYKSEMRKKLNNNNIDVKFYIYGIDEIPYPIIWNY